MTLFPGVEILLGDDIDLMDLLTLPIRNTCAKMVKEDEGKATTWYGLIPLMVNSSNY